MTLGSTCSANPQPDGSPTVHSLHPALPAAGYRRRRSRSWLRDKARPASLSGAPRAARQSFYISVSHFSQRLFQILSLSSDPLPSRLRLTTLSRGPALDFSHRTQVIGQEGSCVSLFASPSPGSLPFPHPSASWGQGPPPQGRHLVPGATLFPFGQALPPHWCFSSQSRNTSHK